MLAKLLIRMFYDLSADINFASFSNTDRARSLITDGKFALDQQNWQELARVNASLIGLLPGNMSAQFGGGRLPFGEYAVSSLNVVWL